MTKRGCLGVEGKGVAPHWRLTELGYMQDPPTRDFLKWNGEVFHEQKSPAHYKRRQRSLAKLRKQNPVPLNGTDCTAERHIPVYQGAVQLPEEVYQGAAHISVPACTTERHISRVNHSAATGWSAPTLVELPWSGHWANAYASAESGATKLTLVPDVGDGLDIPSFLDRRGEVPA